MTNPIQLLRDFLKWRKERLDKEYQEVLKVVAYEVELLAASSGMKMDKYDMAVRALAYGIEHRKEILKRVKI